MELLVDAGAEVDRAERFGPKLTALMAAAMRATLMLCGGC